MPKSDLQLPEDFVQFVSRGMQLEYDGSACECGHVTLLPLEALAEEEVVVMSSDTSHALDDPHADEGVYVTNAVNIIAEAEEYDPEFILCWLPAMKCFASYDTDHAVMRVFTGTTWASIAADPVRYLNAQWAAEGEVPGDVPKPWEHFTFQKYEE